MCYGAVRVLAKCCGGAARVLAVLLAFLLTVRAFAFR
jgi:hypothetical protein